MSVVVSDVAELKEAIERFVVQAVADAVQVPNGGAAALSPDEQAVVVAARRWVRMVETGEQVEWCVEHLSNALPEGPGGNPGLRRCWYVSWLLDRASGESVTVCRIESRLVAAVGVEKETL